MMDVGCGLWAGHFILELFCVCWVGVVLSKCNVSSRLCDIGPALIFYVFKPLFSMIGSCLFIDFSTSNKAPGVCAAPARFLFDCMSVFICFVKLLDVELFC